MKKLIVILLVCVAVWQIYSKKQSKPMDVNSVDSGSAMARSEIEASTASKPAQIFSCDGRVYCTEMTSREEAEFFIRNCPGTKMDGDSDGVPCERDTRF